MITGRMLRLIMISLVLRVSVTVFSGGRVECSSPEESVTGGSVSISEEPAGENCLNVQSHKIIFFSKLYELSYE